jgi:diaminopimelate decarboxylase
MHTNFLTRDQISQIEQKYDLPLYVYSEDKLLEAINAFKNLPSAF